MKFIVFPDRIRRELGRLMDAYYAQNHPFTELTMQGPHQDRNLPTDLPRGGPEEAFYYVQLCNYMSGAADSITMARLFAKLYNQSQTTLFNCHRVADMDPLVISLLLQDGGLSYRASVDEIPKAWQENSRRLREQYDGDVRALFAAADGDWHRLYALLINKNGNGLVGYQEKMASMLAFYLMRKNLVSYFVMPPQVDFHVMRVFWGCNLILPIQDNGNAVHAINATGIRWFQIAIRKALVDHELTTGQNWLDLSEALWTQSRELCRLSPSNSMKKGVAGESWQKPITWTAEQRKRYRAGCGRCAIEPSCTNAVSHAPYYGLGPTELWSHGPRQVPPPEEGVLFDPD